MHARTTEHPGRRTLVAAHVLAAATALALWPVPLFNVVGFEFAAAIGLLLAYVSGLRACGEAARASGAGGVFPGGPLLRTTAAHLTLPLTPLLVLLLRSSWVPACNWREGLLFYALLPLPAVVYGTAVGWGLGLRFSAGRARALFVAWSLATLLVAIVHLIRHPPKFSYNSFVGFFPGPLYDSRIPITPTLVLARFVVLLQAALFVLLAVLGWQDGGARWRAIPRRWHGERAVCGGLAIGVALTLALVEWRAPDLGLRIDRAHIQRRLGGHIETPHFDIYYDRGTISESRAREMADEHEFRFQQLRRFFGVEPGHRVGSYVYASAAQKKQLMGAGGTSFEDAWNDEFHINAAEDPHPVLTHEMAHIFAAQIHPWVPVCWKIGLHEGIAVAAEWNEESARLGLTPHRASAAMDSLGLLPDLEKSLGAIGFWTQPGARAYTAAGSFVRFLVDTYGMPRFFELWPRGDFERAYGKPLPELLREWRTLLARTAPTLLELRRAERLFRRPGVFGQACAHEVARLESEVAAALARREFARAESLLVRLRDIDPEDADHTLQLGRTRLRRGEAAVAYDIARELVNATHVSEAERDRFWRLLGDAAWYLDRDAAAESCYAIGAERAAFEDESRALEVTIAVLHEKRLREILREYLTDAGLPEAAALADLARARLAAPESPLPRYLLGRRLYFAGRFDAARQELEALRGAGLPPRARHAALDLAGRAALRAGHAAAAADTYVELLRLPMEEPERLGAEDWLERCRWVESREMP